MLRCAAVAFSAALLITARSAAQICSGEPTFAEASARLFASAAFGQVETYHGGLAAGGTRVFGWGEAGMTTYRHDESAEYRLGAGVQLSQRPETRLHICPEILLGRTTASNVAGTSVDYVESTASVGADVGYVLFRKGSTRIVPTANLQFVTGRIKWLYVNGVRRTEGIESYGLFGAGIGVRLGDITASPAIILPLGLEGGEIAYVIGVSVRL